MYIQGKSYATEETLNYIRSTGDMHYAASYALGALAARDADGFESALTVLAAALPNVAKDYGL